MLQRNELPAYPRPQSMKLRVMIFITPLNTSHVEKSCSNSSANSNKIRARYAPTKLDSEPNEKSIHPEVEVSGWFVLADGIMQNATDNARKMDFDRHAKGTSRMPHTSYTLDLITAK